MSIKLWGHCTCLPKAIPVQVHYLKYPDNIREDTTLNKPASSTPLSHAKIYRRHAGAQKQFLTTQNKEWHDISLKFNAQLAFAAVQNNNLRVNTVLYYTHTVETCVYNGCLQQQQHISYYIFTFCCCSGGRGKPADKSLFTNTIINIRINNNSICSEM